jgi:transcriptional regulator with XRE-family HTH domain
MSLRAIAEKAGVSPPTVSLALRGSQKIPEPTRERVARIAARLPALPGMKFGLMEMDGNQHYAQWDRLLARHPAAGQSWLKPERGIFRRPASFDKNGGGIFASSVPPEKS